MVKFPNTTTCSSSVQCSCYRISSQRSKGKKLINTVNISASTIFDCKMATKSLLKETILPQLVSIGMSPCHYWTFTIHNSSHTTNHDHPFISTSFKRSNFQLKIIFLFIFSKIKMYIREALFNMYLLLIIIFTNAPNTYNFFLKIKMFNNAFYKIYTILYIYTFLFILDG